jgi:hypothetical protein
VCVCVHLFRGCGIMRELQSVVVNEVRTADGATCTAYACVCGCVTVCVCMCVCVCVCVYVCIYMCRLVFVCFSQYLCDAYTIVSRLARLERLAGPPRLGRLGISANVRVWSPGKILSICPTVYVSLASRICIRCVLQKQFGAKQFSLQHTSRLRTWVFMPCSSVTCQ